MKSKQEERNDGVMGDQRNSFLMASNIIVRRMAVSAWCGRELERDTKDCYTGLAEVGDTNS